MNPPRRLKSLCAALVATGLLFALTAPTAQAQDPLFTFTPVPRTAPPGQPPPPPVPLPNSYLNGPCGLAVDSGGRFYVADGYHDRVHVYSGTANYTGPSVNGATGYITQLALPDDTGPCYVALDSTGDLYVGAYHGAVEKFTPDTYPPDANTTYASQGVIDPGPATGIAVDPATGDLYVNRGDRILVYDSTGAPVMDGPDPLAIGLGTLGEGYSLAVSGFGTSTLRVFAADAADGTVKVYDLDDADPSTPEQVIDGSATSGGGFTSLRDSALAADDSNGDIYVLEDTQPDHTEQPRGRVHVFASTTTYEGHLKFDVIHGRPSGLAVDNSAVNPGRLYASSGNTHEAGLYAYPPGAAVQTSPLPPTIPPTPIGADSLFPVAPIGTAAGAGGGIACEGDACQALPSEPVDPTLTTRLRGLEQPPIRYRNAIRSCAPLARKARRLSRQARRTARRAKAARAARATRRLRARASRLRKRSRRAARAGKRCLARAGGSAVAAHASASSTPSGSAESGGEAPAAQGGSAEPPAGTGTASSSAPSGEPTAVALSPPAEGFEAAAYADGGGPAVLAGSTPYSLELSVGLGAGEDLSELSIDLPAGLLANPAAAGSCSGEDFGEESCADRTQVGTVEVTSAAHGETRAFGLFNLDPAAGTALRLGAAPFGSPLVFNATMRAGGEEAFGLSITALQVPQALEANALAISIWGAPWDATHNTKRGDCLNETEPSFAWCKRWVGEPTDSRPLAFLTLPTACGAPLSFSARAETWSGAGEFTASAVNRDPSSGDPAPMTGCGTLPSFETFDLAALGLLSVSKASSSTGFVFRLENDDETRLANPRLRIRSHPERAVVRLPDGVTLNPSLGAGLKGCTPAELAKETAFNPPGAGCPNGSKIGEFRVRSPFYEGFLRGSVYLAKPRENPFGALLAVYLVAKSADRGLLIRLPGELAPGPSDGTITATFSGLPQIPYTDLEINFRSGQRAPLVSPPRCGAATTQTTLTPSSGGESVEQTTDIQITSGIDFGPCPNGSTPPFDPEAVAGGVNSNVGSYTPYYVRLSRDDEEQEITSYSLVLPKGITGRLQGIPFCSDTAIARARGRDGFDEIADPSCPSASQVGSTNTGYGVGPALTYAPGRIYLAGPYGGQPLSLVTINAATVGPFDLGTIVIRSAFSIDPRTAQLQIDSEASDPIPHIIDGVPLHLRDIRITMDRFRFTRNPTGCGASELVSTLTGSGRDFGNPADDSTARVGEHFQLLNCLDLGFTPRLGLRLLGSPRRSAYPALRAVLRAKDGEASMKRMEVTMPKSLFLAQNHIRGVCTRPQFAAERCPKNSIYGRAVVYSSLFDEPLRGPVYLRSSDNRLPDLVASLRSGEVRIVLEGRIGPSKQGGVRTFFDNVPDAPIEAFVMQLNGGRRGLLVNSVNVCNSPPSATVRALGQNNKGVIYTTKLRGNCKKFKAAQKRKRAALKRKRQRQRRQAQRRKRS